MRDIDPTFLREAFSYDPETGKLTWKERPRHHFPNQRTQRIVNSRCAGMEAGKPGTRGYLKLVVAGHHLLAHRVIWLMVHGAEPDGILDHFDRDRTNNRLSNLREIHPSLNSKNRTRSSLNTSGVNGVTWNRNCQKWQVMVAKTYVGVFESIHEARIARRKAEAGLGYTPDHGSARS